MSPLISAATLLAVILFSSCAFGGELWIGAATVNITPDRPVALAGQRHLRIARKIKSPVTASALAMEIREGDRAIDQAIFVSCDLVAIREGVTEMLREKLKGRLDGVDLTKIVLSATHTHTAPVTKEGTYTLPKEGVIQPSEYREFLIERLAEVIAEAWKIRQPGRVGWGLGHAVIAMSRLPVYDNGTSRMYGPSNRPDFQRFEGYEDHGVEVLCFWDRQDKLIATAINIACPSQEVEGASYVSADFWHPVREMLRERYGEELIIVPWTGASGDQTSHIQWRKSAEARMRRLRGQTALDDIASRIVTGWEQAHAGAVQEKHDDVPLVHHVESLALPVRLVTEAEAEAARKRVAALGDNAAKKWDILWNQRVVDRFENQSPGDTFPMELHVVRLGDVAIATNWFELYTDYGIQMKARSPALQTFIVQIAGPGSYLPTARAVAGGAYGAVPQSSRVGPKGGKVLVDRTVEVIKKQWARQ